MNNKLLPCLLAASLAAVALPAAAQSAGDWTIGIGVHQVDPKSDNGVLANAWPFPHDISVKGVGRVGSTKHLPPTVSLQYHFNDKGVVSPVLGVGLNYTTFFSEDTRGALDGTSLKLGDSWGLAAHAGLDFRVSEKAAIRVDVRWIDIDSRVRVDGARMGTANIDPLVYGAAYVMKF